MVEGKMELIVIPDQPDVYVRQTLVRHRSQPVRHHRQQVGLNEGQLQLYLFNMTTLLRIKIFVRGTL